MEAVKICKVGKKYKNGVQALESVNFSVEKGEFVSIIGASGAGKTTLIRMLNGAVRPTHGEIYMNCKGNSSEGVPFNQLNGKAKRSVQQRIGTIYQDFCLVDNSTCLQNVLNADIPKMNFISVLFGVFSQEQKKRAIKALEMVGIQEKADVTAGQLSGGQKQRVAIARAIMQHPNILLADEPVASLDPYTADQIMHILKRLQQEFGITIIMNSHNIDISLQFSDRIIGIKKGVVALNKRTEAITKENLQEVYGGQYEK